MDSAKLDDDQIWERCSDLLDEMEDHGMCFFEGFIPAIAIQAVQPGLTELGLRVTSTDCSSSVWAEDSSETDWNREYRLDEYCDLLVTAKLLTLHVNYEFISDGRDLRFKLIFDWIEGSRTDLDLLVICYREGLLPRHGARPRFLAAVQHQRDLREQFGGAALFVGPDTPNEPRWPSKIPQEWVRIE